MTKALFFDAGPVITLVISRLSWILPLLKKKFGGEFYITPAVYYELVERPLLVKRFKFEALQVLKMIKDETLVIYEDVPQKKVDQLISLANNTFSIKGKSLDIIQEGEMESLASALESNASAVVMDERTLRLFIENKDAMQHLLGHRFNAEISINRENLNSFASQTKGVPIIRSIELIATAYTLGFLKDYVPPRKGGKEILLDSVLWAAKYNGSAVTESEVEEIKKKLL
ncbi:TPA: hypothetical protein HA241_03250 [Candidatus Woesearchaeota archaeon]|nr:hypothetical protein [Candidatus Woesearchaeota archaeon]